PDTVPDFSAVGYLFGRELQSRYHVPIGIIESDFGGTPAEVWTSAAALKPFPEFAHALDSLAHADDAARAEYEQYLKTRSQWNTAHENEDRGRDGNRYLWSDPNLDDHDWPTINLPRPWFLLGKDFKGFGGTMWFRKTFNLTADQTRR